MGNQERGHQRCFSKSFLKQELWGTGARGGWLLPELNPLVSDVSLGWAENQLGRQDRSTKPPYETPPTQKSNPEVGIVPAAGQAAVPQPEWDAQHPAACAPCHSRAQEEGPAAPGSSGAASSARALGPCVEGVWQQILHTSSPMLFQCRHPVMCC